MKMIQDWLRFLWRARTAEPVHPVCHSPLTPALSPRERGKCHLPFRPADTPRYAEARDGALPLLGERAGVRGNCSYERPKAAFACRDAYKGRIQAGLLCVSLAGGLACASAQQIQILSLSQNGLLTWSNATLNATCRVEWASSVQGPWFSSWDSLASIVATNHVTQRSVPMFYRVVCAQVVTNITPEAALALLNGHKGDTNLIILDVRTPAEYAPRHIKGAVNLDYLATDFDVNLALLDRGKTYLVYCKAGGRSRLATEKMRTLGFLQVYDMTGGFDAFVLLSGADEFLEP